MFTRLIRSNPFIKQIRSKKKKAQPPKEVTTSKTAPPAQTQQELPVTQTNQLNYFEKKVDNAKASFIFDYIQKGNKIEDVVDFEYKKYPTHIDHWNPESEGYISAPREEKTLRDSINEHNDVLDQFKRDLKLQEQVTKALANLDRPYLREGIPGQTRNVYNELADYRDEKIDEPSIFKEMDAVYDAYSNEKMIINNTPFPTKTVKFSNEVEWEEMQENRPATRNYHLDKGYKFDVEVPYDQRYPHVADRLGHPEIFLSPVASLLRLENDIAHPGNLDLAFVQTPKAEPDAALDFTAGEMLYENTIVSDWVKTGYVGFSLFQFYYLAVYPVMTFLMSSVPQSSVLEEVPFSFAMQDYSNFDYYGFLPFGHILTAGLVSYIGSVS